MGIEMYGAILIAAIIDPITLIAGLIVAFCARFIKWWMAIVLMVAVSWPISWLRTIYIYQTKYDHNYVRLDKPYDTFKEIRGTRFEPHFQKFVGVYTRQQAEKTKAQIIQDERDCAILLQATEASVTLANGPYYRVPPKMHLTDGAGLLNTCTNLGRIVGAVAAFLAMVLFWAILTLMRVPKHADRYRSS